MNTVKTRIPLHTMPNFSNVRLHSPVQQLSFSVFSTGQSVRPEPGPGGTAVCRPVRSFSKVARQVRIKDEDGRHSVVPSRLFLNLPDKKNSGTRTEEIVSSPSPPAVPCRSPPSSAVFRRFPLFSAVACPPPLSPAVLHHPLQEYVSGRGACRPS